MERLIKFLVSILVTPIIIIGLIIMSILMIFLPLIVLVHPDSFKITKK